MSFPRSADKAAVEHRDFAAWKAKCEDCWLNSYDPKDPSQGTMKPMYALLCKNTRPSTEVRIEDFIAEPTKVYEPYAAYLSEAIVYRVLPLWVLLRIIDFMIGGSARRMRREAHFN